MDNINIFAVASKNKYRFPFKGLISVEELWDLSLENLDSIFKTLNSEKKKASEESLLDTKSKEDDELDVKIEIVKWIVSVKLAENQAKLNARENKAKKQRILELISQKQDAEDQAKSKEELMAMLNELN